VRKGSCGEVLCPGHLYKIFAEYFVSGTQLKRIACPRLINVVASDNLFYKENHSLSFLCELPLLLSTGPLCFRNAIRDWTSKSATERGALNLRYSIQSKRRARFLGSTAPPFRFFHRCAVSSETLFEAGRPRAPPNTPNATCPSWNSSGAALFHQIQASTSFPRFYSPFFSFFTGALRPPKHCSRLDVRGRCRTVRMLRTHPGGAAELLPRPEPLKPPELRGSGGGPGAARLRDLAPGLCVPGERVLVLHAHRVQLHSQHVGERESLKC
jgi:hypothetical protein